MLTVPLAPDEAFDRVDSWFEPEHVRTLDPGPWHLKIARELVGTTGATLDGEKLSPVPGC